MSIEYNTLSVENNTTVVGNVRTSGNIVSGGTITGNTISIADGANLGTIDQISTELTLSSTGSKIAIGSGSALVFKNNNESQLSAYTAREIVDDCDIFTFMYNIYNFPSIYALSSTFALNQSTPTTISVAANTIYAYPIRLIKGQVVNGAVFYFASAAGTPSITYGLYSTASPAARLAVTSAANTSAGLRPIAFTSAYTVPTTGIYYVCLFASSIGSGLTMVGMPGNIYMNYGLVPMTSGVLNKAAQTSSTAGGLAATLTGLTMTLSTQVAYALVYSLTNYTG